MFHKCCVVSCPSRRKDDNLYRFPKTEEAFQKWLECIHCDRLCNLSVEDLRKQFVCQKHFEKKFIASTAIRPRLVVGAYPSLFADSEISSGIPLKMHLNNTNAANLQRKEEHSYAKKRLHQDHTYCKFEPIDKQSKMETESDVTIDLDSNNPVSHIVYEALSSGCENKSSKKPISINAVLHLITKNSSLSLQPHYTCARIYKKYSKLRKQLKLNSQAQTALMFCKKNS